MRRSYSVASALRVAPGMYAGYAAGPMAWGRGDIRRRTRRTGRSRERCPVIETNELPQRFKNVTAVDGLTFTVQPGRVTGFLGPNGSGKSTTLRMILGLNEPTHGSALIDGHRFRDAGTGLRRVGALLDAGDV